MKTNTKAGKNVADWHSSALPGKCPKYICFSFPTGKLEFSYEETAVSPRGNSNGTMKAVLKETAGMDIHAIMAGWILAKIRTKELFLAAIVPFFGKNV